MKAISTFSVNVNEIQMPLEHLPNIAAGRIPTVTFKAWHYTCPSGNPIERNLVRFDGDIQVTLRNDGK